MIIDKLPNCRTDLAFSIGTPARDEEFVDAHFSDRDCCHPADTTGGGLFAGPRTGRGKVGPDSQSSLTALPGSSAPLERNNPYGAPPPAPQERPGFAGVVSAGQVVSRDTAIDAQSGGTGTAFVNGQRVQVDVNTRRIIRAY